MIESRDIERREFSQNGEDGIIDFLVSRLAACRRRFLEIGAGKSWKTNVRALIERGWSGEVFEKKEKCCRTWDGLPGVRVICSEVGPATVWDIDLEPDVFSLDIDGYDYPVAESLLAAGLRPQIAVLEYNPLFGGEVRYIVDGPTDKQKRFGASIAAWRELWGPRGYTFLCVESSGANCFFVRSGACHPLDDVRWLQWADNRRLHA